MKKKKNRNLANNEKGYSQLCANSNNESAGN